MLEGPLVISFVIVGLLPLILLVNKSRIRRMIFLQVGARKDLRTFGSVCMLGANINRFVDSRATDLSTIGSQISPNLRAVLVLPKIVPTTVGRHSRSDWLL